MLPHQLNFNMQRTGKKQVIISDKQSANTKNAIKTHLENCSGKIKTLNLIVVFQNFSQNSN